MPPAETQCHHPVLLGSALKRLLPLETVGAEEVGPEHLCQAGSHRGPGGGHRRFRERPHCLLVFVPEAAKRPALPAWSAPTSPHTPSTVTDLAAQAWPQPRRIPALASQPLRDEGSTDQPSQTPLPAASPFLVCIAQAEERAELPQFLSTRGEDIGTPLTPLVPGITAPCSSPSQVHPQAGCCTQEGS